MNQRSNDGSGAWIPNASAPGTSQDTLKKSKKSSKNIRYWHIPTTEGSISTLPKVNKPTSAHLTPKVSFTSDLPSKSTVFTEIPGIPGLPHKSSTAGDSVIKRSSSFYGKTPAPSREVHRTIRVPDNDFYDGSKKNADSGYITSPSFTIQSPPQNFQDSSTKCGFPEILLQDLNLSSLDISPRINSVSSEKSPSYRPNKEPYDNQALAQFFFKKVPSPASPPPLLPRRSSQSADSDEPPELPPKPPGLSANSIDTASRRQSRNLFDKGFGTAQKRRTFLRDSSDHSLLSDELHHPIHACKCSSEYLRFGHNQVRKTYDLNKKR